MRLNPVITAAILAPGCAAPVSDPGRDAQGTRGAVTSDHRLASEAGLRVLQNGGNAMDAAITMAATVAVARPHMNGLGGDMFLLYFEAATGKVHALNASGPAGARATIQRVRTVHPKGDDMPDDGPTTVSVPGAVRGWAAALERFGTIPWRQALEPAVQLARNGLPVSERLSLDIAEEVEKLGRDSEAARIFLPGGAPPAAGALLKLDDLAATFARVQANGPDEIYAGETSRRIVAHLKSVGGFLEASDLAGYQPSWVEPITAEYRGLTAMAFPPNTQGVTFLEELLLLQRQDLASLGHNSPDYLHTITQAIRLAVADRDSSVADPRSMRVTVEHLLAVERIAGLAAGIDPGGRADGGGVAMGMDHPNTVYIIAVDAQGNVVSMIQSLFASFGAGIVVPGTGVVLHNRGALFTLDPKHPNALAPGKLPYHTLCPLMAFKAGKPWLAFGTPGGDGQTHTDLQVLHNILLFGMTPQQAIDAPRLRRMASGEVRLEDRIPEDVRLALEARGYRATRRPSSADFGGAQAVLIENGRLRAGADRRREAWAAAY